MPTLATAGTLSLEGAPTLTTAWKQSTDGFLRKTPNSRKLEERQKSPKLVQQVYNTYCICLGNSSLLAAYRLAENISALKFLLLSSLF